LEGSDQIESWGLSTERAEVARSSRAPKGLEKREAGGSMRAGALCACCSTGIAFGYSSTCFSTLFTLASAILSAFAALYYLRYSLSY